MRLGPSVRTLIEGCIAALAFLPGIFVLGAIFGASAGPAGIGPPTAVVMSLLVWSGAGQFAALPLWRDGAWVVAASALVLSLRFSLMSAALGPLLGSAKWPWPLRALIAFTITDESFALAAIRSQGRVDPLFLLGSWIPLYLPWIAGTLVGVSLGQSIPDAARAPLEAVFPLVFLALTVLVCTSRALAGVALLGGALSILGTVVLPVGWNVLAAGLLASVLGALVEMRLHGAGRARGQSVGGTGHHPL